MTMKRLVVTVLCIGAMLVGLGAIQGCGKKEEPVVSTVHGESATSGQTAKAVAQSNKCVVYKATEETRGVAGRDIYWVESTPSASLACGGLVVR